MLKYIFPNQGAVESKENSLKTSYGPIYDMIDTACCDLANAMSKPNPGAVALWKELCCFVLSQNSRVSTLGTDRTAVSLALLPAKVVDWLDPCRGVYLYGERDSMNLKGWINDTIEDLPKRSKELTEAWENYAEAVIAIQRSVNRRNAVPCDKPLINNDVKLFTTDMGYLRINEDPESSDAVLIPNVVGKMYPVLNINGPMWYDGGSTLSVSNYAGRLGDSMIALFQQLGA